MKNAPFKDYQPLQPHDLQDKTGEVFLADFTHDQSIAGSFAAAARMASTPFCNGIGPMSLPTIPCSTIRSTNEIPEWNDLAANGVSIVFHACGYGFKQVVALCQRPVKF